MEKIPSSIRVQSRLFCFPIQQKVFFFSANGIKGDEWESETMTQQKYKM